MKKHSLILITLGIICLFVSSCTKDKCEEIHTYTSYQAVYMTLDELRNSIEIEGPQTLSKPGKIYIKGDYLFINEYNNGVHIINNANPGNPEFISFINVPGNVDLAVKENTLLLDSYIDLVAFDISNPAAPSFVSRFESAFPPRTYDFANDFDPALGVVSHWEEIEVENIVDCNTEWIGSGGGWFINDLQFDNGIGSSQEFTSFSNVNAPSAASAPLNSGVGGSLARFTVRGCNLYAVDQQDLRVFDITNPTEINSTSVQSVGTNIETIFPYKENLFIGSANGMFIYDISNPINPVRVSQFLHVETCDPVIVYEDIAYVTLRDGNLENANSPWCNGGNTNQLDIIDVSDVYHPDLLNTILLTQPHGLGADEDLLFICDGDDGLKVYDIISPGVIDPKITFENIQMTDVIPYNDILYGIGPDGIYFYDYSNVEDIQLLGSLIVQ